jgi:myo-inositol catabolism protein IolH
MVKILLDPSMYHPHLSVAEECQKAADLGYQYLELSPRWDFHEWHHYPKVDRAELAKVKAAMATTGVKIWTFNPVFNWASPDEQERQAQVRNFRRLLAVRRTSSRSRSSPPSCSGDPNRAAAQSERQFFRSRSRSSIAALREARPRVRRSRRTPTTSSRPTTRAVQASSGASTGPGSTTSSAARTCSTCRQGAGRTSSGAAWSTPAPRLRHLHVADVFNHLANVGNRYIVNPPGVDARIHQHNEIGNGEVPWGRRLRATCASIGVRRHRSAVCVFGWEERRRRHPRPRCGNVSLRSWAPRHGSPEPGAGSSPALSGCDARPPTGPRPRRGRSRLRRPRAPSRARRPSSAATSRPAVGRGPGWSGTRTPPPPPR